MDKPAVEELRDEQLAALSRLAALSHPAVDGHFYFLSQPRIHPSTARSLAIRGYLDRKLVGAGSNSVYVYGLTDIGLSALANAGKDKP